MPLMMPAELDRDIDRVVVSDRNAALIEGLVHVIEFILVTESAQTDIAKGPEDACSSCDCRDHIRQCRGERKEVEEGGDRSDDGHDVSRSRVEALASGKDTERKEERSQKLGEHGGPEYATLAELHEQLVDDIHGHSHGPQQGMGIVIEVHHEDGEPYYRHVVEVLFIFPPVCHCQRFFPFFLFLLSSSIISCSCECPAPSPSSTSEMPGPLCDCLSCCS